MLPRLHHSLAMQQAANEVKRLRRLDNRIELIHHLSFDQPPDRPLQLTWPRDVRVSLAIRGWREVAR
jgi:hypothetical protein